MENCLFCEIVSGAIPSAKVYENDHVLAFDDIHPMAPVHVIAVPKRHIPTLMDIGTGDADVIAAMIAAAQEIARIKGVAERGFRTVINCDAEGGQVIFHLHMHVIGGRNLADNLG